MLLYGKIFNVSTGKGEIVCQSKTEIAEIIKQSATLLQGNEVWVSLSVLIKGQYACVHYFKNDEGDVWQSCGNFNKEVTFFAGEGDREWVAPGYVIVPLEKAISCMEEFCDTFERPNCIEWEALWEED